MHLYYWKNDRLRQFLMNLSKLLYFFLKMPFFFQYVVMVSILVFPLLSIKLGFFLSVVETEERFSLSVKPAQLICWKVIVVKWSEFLSNLCQAWEILATMSLNRLANKLRLLKKRVITSHVPMHVDPHTFTSLSQVNQKKGYCIE